MNSNVQKFNGILTWLVRDQSPEKLFGLFTGFDHMTNQVHIPVKFLTCCLFLKNHMTGQEIICINQQWFLFCLFIH